MTITDTLKGLAKRAEDQLVKALGGEEPQGELFGLSFHLENVRNRVNEAKTAEEKLQALIAESNRLKEWYFEQKKKADGNEKPIDSQLTETARSYTETKEQIGTQLDLLKQVKANTEESVQALDTAVRLVEAQGATLSAADSAQVAAARAACTEAKRIGLEIAELIGDDDQTAKIDRALANARARSDAASTPAEKAKQEVTRVGAQSELDYLFSTMPKVDVPLPTNAKQDPSATQEPPAPSSPSNGTPEQK